MMVVSNKVSTKALTLDHKSGNHKIAGWKNRGYVELLDEVMQDDNLFTDEETYEEEESWGFNNSWLVKI